VEHEQGAPRALAEVEAPLRASDDGERRAGERGGHAPIVRPGPSGVVAPGEAFCVPQRWYAGAISPGDGRRAPTPRRRSPRRR